jgi:hypothetical protein
MEDWVSGLNQRFAKPPTGVTRSRGSNPLSSAPMGNNAGYENRIPLNHLGTYNDIYDLKFSESDLTTLDALYTVLKGCSVTYVHGAGTKERDFVMQFTDREASVRLVRTDDIAKKFGYKVFRTFNSRYYLKFVPKAQDLKFLDTLGKLDNRSQEGFLFNSMDELATHMLTKDLEKIFRQKAFTTIDYVTLLFWVVGKLDDFNANKYANTAPYQKLPDDIGYIVDVLQLADDTRLAIFIEHSKYNQNYNTGFGANIVVKMYLAKPENQCYNWTDPDRYFSHISKETGHGKVYYSGPNPPFVDDKAMSRYIRGHKFIVVENDTLEMIAKREQRRQLEDMAMKTAADGIKKKLQDKIAKLQTNGEFTFNEVTFRRHELEYEGQILKCTQFEMSDVINQFSYNISDDYFNFERIHDEFLKRCVQYAETDGHTKCSGTIGVVDFTIEHKVKVGKVKTVSTYINGFRINKSELSDVLARALCYTSTTDFDTFVKSVSKCSLRYHRALAAGLRLNVRDEILGDAISFKIGLTRVKNRNYISFGDKIRYPVKDSNKLLAISDSTDVTRVINTLLDADVVGMTGVDIKHILAVGQEVLRQEKEKENTMLTQTVNLFKCEHQADALLDNGRLVSGYAVKGKLRDYIIDDNSLRVFEYPSGKYLCMVDKGQNEHTNTARLVSRMFALANDSMLAKEITTLAKTK